MGFHTAGVGNERMRIDSSGNVGIGTASIDSGVKIHVEESSASLTAATTSSVALFERAGNAGISIGTANTGECTIFFQDTDSATIGRVKYDHADDSLGFWANSLERMRIDSSGNLLVGNTSAGSPLGSLGAAIKANGVIHTRIVASGTGVQFQVGGSLAGGITVTNGGTPSFFSGSDIRLKDNVTDHESELANVMALRPVRWDWKDETLGSGEGFIAQELEQTAWADLVSEGEDGYKQVSGLGTVETRLIKALQEAVTRIETLEAEVAALKGA